MKRMLAVAALLTLSSPCFADSETFNHVKIHRHRSAEHRELVDKLGTLAFDDGNRKFSFTTNPEGAHDTQSTTEIRYDSVTKIVFEVTTHMRGGGLAETLNAAGVPVAGTVIARQHVEDYWFYIAYQDDGGAQELLFELPKNASPTVIDKAKNLFGPRVTIAEFQEKGEEVDPKTLSDIKSKQRERLDKNVRPLPEVKPDKATIVVVCPPLAARFTGRGNQFKLHANDHVIAINREGTYSVAYLDPGKYRLVSQSENANGFEMEVEAGKTYYFLQNIFQGFLKGQTMLSRNSPELVTYLMSGTYFSDWSLK